MLEVKHEPLQMVRVAPAIKDLKTNVEQIESEISSSHILPGKAPAKTPTESLKVSANYSEPKNTAAPKVTSDGVTVYRVENDSPSALNTPKVGRNDSCPCGSGKKYKKCCGK